MMDGGTFLYLVAKGYIHGRRAPIIENGIQSVEAYINPLPAGLVLTGIVVSVCMTAFSLALVQRLNYVYLERNHLGNYVKYNYFHAEKKKKFRENIYRTENLPYDEETNTYTCPAGKKLAHHRTVKTRSDNNYLKTEELYRCEDCSFCTQAASCKKTEKNRQIRVSHPLKKYRMQANENLCSKTRKRLRSQRVVEVEQTFGRLKGCWGFRRFLLRGKEKVKIEWGLLAIAYNITKIALEKLT